MDSSYLITQGGRAIGTFLFSWVAFTLIAQWTKTPIYDNNDNVIWGNTAYMVFLAMLVAWALVLLVELVVWFFMGATKTV